MSGVDSIDKYSKMMSWLTRSKSKIQEPRNMYQEGQLVAPSVDGSRPGYRGRKWENVIAAGSRSENLKRLLPKNKSKYISLTELRNLLGEGAQDMRALGGTKDTVVARASAKLLDQTSIIGPGRDRPSTRKYFFYKKPTTKELELLKTYIDARPIQADMFERIQNLQKDKYTAQILKDGKLPMVGEGKKRNIDLKFMKHVKSKYGTLDKYVHGLVRYSQGLDGQTIIGLNDSILSDGKFKTNKKIANKIRSTFLEMPYGSGNASMNTIRKAVYKSAMMDITNELGNQNTTFEQWKDRLRRTLNRKYNLKGADVHIDELIGVSSSMRNKTAPYAVFTQLATKELNEGILKDYQKVLSNHTAKLKTEINKNSKFVDGKWWHSAEATNIKNNFNKNILPNLENIDQLKGTGFSLPEMTLGAPTDKTLGGVKGRLATLEKAGLGFKEFYKKQGFGYKMPKNVATQKELFTQLKLNKHLSPRHQQLIKNQWCPDTFNKGGGAGTCPIEEAMDNMIKKTNDVKRGAVKGTEAARIASKASKVARFGTGAGLAKVLGPLGLGAEAVFEVALAAPGYAKGESGKRLLGDSILGLIPGVGQSAEEEFDEYATKAGMSELEQQKIKDANKFIELEQGLVDMVTAGILEGRGAGRGGQHKGINKFMELQEEYIPLYNQFVGAPPSQNLSAAFAEQDRINQTIEEAKAVRKQQRQDSGIVAQDDWYRNVNTRGYAEGGIASLKKKW